MKRTRFLRAALKKVPILAAVLAFTATAVHWTGGSALALTQTDCRGCHGTGTTLSTTAIHHALSTTKGYACTKCHQQVPDGTGGYTVTVTRDCFVCHVNATHELVHTPITRPADCAQCHTLSTVDEHTSRGSTCGTCHDSTVPEVLKAITDGKAGLPVNCLTCHTTVSINGHVHPFLQSSAECSTCHILAPLEEHTSRGSTCATCHSSTSTAVINAIAAGKAGTFVNCVSCHGSGYSHPTAHNKTYTPYADCATCHTGTLPALHQAKGFACASCHNGVASQTVRDAVSTSAAGGTIYCATCHTTFGNHALQHDKVARPVGSADFITTHEQSKPTSYCFGCHTTTVAARLKAIDDGMKGVAVSCTTCHPTMIPANLPPTAVAGPDVTGYTGAAITFSGAGSTDTDGTIASYHWNFGDGATATGVSASHAYTAVGSYWVTLTVTDNAGAVATDTVIVTVQQGVAYTPVDEALYITRLSSATTSDTSGTRTTVTTNFKDNNLTTGYAVSYSSRSGSNVATMRVNRDALTATKVVLRFYVSSISGSQTVRVYPYSSGFSSVNSTYSSSYTITGTGWKELDVTTLAQRMNGLGAMKFRLTTTGSFSVSEGNFTIQ